MVWQVLVIAIIAYLIGSINPSIILSKLLGKGDIRTQGMQEQPIHLES